MQAVHLAALAAGTKLQHQRERREPVVFAAGDSLVFSGTGLQATTVAVSGEVIQLEQWVMPDFLL